MGYRPAPNMGGGNRRRCKKGAVTPFSLKRPFLQSSVDYGDPSAAFITVNESASSLRFIGSVHCFSPGRIMRACLFAGRSFTVMVPPVPSREASRSDPMHDCSGEQIGEPYRVRTERYRLTRSHFPGNIVQVRCVAGRHG